MKQINYLIRIRNTLKLAFPPQTECGERQTISVMTGGTLLKTVFNLTSQGQWAPTTVSGSGWKLWAFPKDGGRVAWQLNISNIATRAKTFPWKKRLTLQISIGCLSVISSVIALALKRWCCLIFTRNMYFSDEYFLIVQIVQTTSRIDNLTNCYLLAPSGSFLEPFSAHGKSFRKIYRKKRQFSNFFSFQ